MPLRFASARTPGRSPIARALARFSLPNAANDARRAALSEDTVLQEALRHFAVHGLGSARSARRLADDAWNNGDTAEYNRWIAICRMFDRRLAALAPQERATAP